MACNPTRRLQDNQFLLVKNEIKFTDGTYNKEPLLSILKQKPNRKILGLFRFHLWLYNTVNKEKMEKKKEEKIKKREAWNLAHPDKTPKDTTNVTTGREKIQNIGEEPVVLDTALTHTGSKQLRIFLFKKGYFNATVKDSIQKVGKKKAEVIYSISLGEPYKIRNVADSSLDPVVLYYVNSSQAKTLLHAGDNYDADILDKERSRITTELRNNGFYFFNKNYITYSNDSNLNSHQVDIGLYINRVNENVSEQTLNGKEARNHYQYDLNNIYIQTDYNPQKLDESIATDTIYYKDYIFLATTPYERYKKDVILGTIFFKKGDRFNLGDIDYSYARISDLNIFKFNNIKFEEVSNDSSNGKHLLNAFVQLSPVAMQDVSLEPEATRNGGYAGIAGNLAYHNKNLFRGAELLEIKFKGAAENQQSITGSIVNNGSSQLFNTFEFGPEASLSFKRFFFPLSLFKTSRYFNPKTTFIASYSFQDRPDYSRSVLTGSYGFTWKTTQTQRFTLVPVEINSVRIGFISSAFQDNLNVLQNPSLDNSFKTHLITSFGRGSWEYSEQQTKHGIDFNYLKVDWDMAFKTFTNSDGFARLDFDYRHYLTFNSHNNLVFRAYAGAGQPFNGDISMPFEKSFYAGGSNDIRAWRFSTLGPGSFKNPSGVEQTGDLKLEGNIELRSELFRFIEGAVFADFGNIWTTNAASSGPNAVFHFSDFTQQVALGTGVGIRLNFNFFIFRLDGAVPLYNPSLDQPDRWVYSQQKPSSKDIIFNFGIGYPF